MMDDIWRQELKALERIRKFTNLSEKKELWVLTLYPDKPTLEMKVSSIKLREFFNIRRLWYEAGIFPKGDSPKHIDLRGKLLANVPNDHWLIILDSDELLFGDFKHLEQMMEIMEKQNYYVANILEIRSSLDMLLRPRLIFKKEGMHYRKKHDEIYYKDKNILSSQNIRISLQNIGFLHYKFPDHLTARLIRQPAAL